MDGSIVIDDENGTIIEKTGMEEVAEDIKNKAEPRTFRRTAYILTNPPPIATQKMKNYDVERIDAENFLLEQKEINDIQKGQWFILVEPYEKDGKPLTKVVKNQNNEFLFNCQKNYMDNERVDVVSLIDFPESDRKRVLLRLSKLVRQLDKK